MSWSEILISFLETFVVVIFVIALGILTLEIVRLLIDMREKMIRKEARYLFILLVGLCTVIIIKGFSIIYNAISSILGRKDMKLEGAEDYIQTIYEHIIKNVAEDMNEEINMNNRNDEGGKIPYNSFKGKTTKK